MPLPTRPTKGNVVDEYINFLSAHAVPKSMTLKEIQQATQADQQLQAVIKALRTDNWPQELQRLHSSRQALTITAHHVLLHGTRIVVPQQLRSRILDIAHHGHRGIVKTKQLLRSKV